jgi:hypothetical protein
VSSWLMSNAMLSKNTTCFLRHAVAQRAASDPRARAGSSRARRIPSRDTPAIGFLTGTPNRSVASAVGIVEQHERAAARTNSFNASTPALPSAFGVFSRSAAREMAFAPL